MMKKLVTILSAMFMATPLIAHNGPKPDGQSGFVLGKPLSAIEIRHAEQILNDGTRDDHPSSSLFYRDEKGRMREESQTKIVIFDPVAGLLYTMDVKTKSFRKIPVQPGSSVAMAVVEDGVWVAIGESALAKPTGNAQSATETLPAKIANGIRLRGLRTTSTIPAGTFANDHDLKIVNEQWYADDINVLMKSSNSDPRTGTTTYELTNVQQTRPDPSLFQVPAGFTLLSDNK
jgi:hypothetical protein